MNKNGQKWGQTLRYPPIIAIDTDNEGEKDTHLV